MSTDMAEDTLIRVVEEREALRAEVARLQRHVKMLEVELDGSERDHEAAKADHENALANCMHVLRERDDARARVAELERERDNSVQEETDMRAEWEAEGKRRNLAEIERDDARAALDQARGFTERALAYLSDEEDLESTPLHAIGHARTELRGLLAAIPATATPAATGAERRRVSDRRSVWSCKIGRLGVMALPDGCDLPMRRAVREAYYRITGVEEEFIFSGWNTDLTETELAVVEDREPRGEKEQGT